MGFKEFLKKRLNYEMSGLIIKIVFGLIILIAIGIFLLIRR